MQVRPCSSASAAPSHLSQPAVDSLGRVLSETSDSGSGSSSDSESDSEDTTELQGGGGCKLAAAMAAVDSPTPPLNPASTFSMPGELSDLFLTEGAPTDEDGSSMAGLCEWEKVRLRNIREQKKTPLAAPQQ